MILANRNGIAISYVRHNTHHVILSACCNSCETRLTRDGKNFWFCPLCRTYFGKVNVSNSYFILPKEMSRMRRIGVNLWASTWLGQDVEVSVDW